MGHGVGDYDSAGDNQISIGQRPARLGDAGHPQRHLGLQEGRRELEAGERAAAPAGRGRQPQRQLPAERGPDRRGRDPPAQRRSPARGGPLDEGKRRSIYGTQASPFPYEPSWGTATAKPGKLYLHVFDWPKGELVVYGLRNKITKAYLLAGNKPREGDPDPGPGARPRHGPQLPCRPRRRARTPRWWSWRSTARRKSIPPSSSSRTASWS